MLDGSDPKLLYEWMEYSVLEPFGDERADIRNAITCSVIAQAMGLKKKGGGSFTIPDFIPVFNAQQKSSEIPADKAEALMRRRYANNRKPGR